MSKPYKRNRQSLHKPFRIGFLFGFPCLRMALNEHENWACLYGGGGSVMNTIFHTGAFCCEDRIWCHRFWEKNLKRGNILRSTLLHFCQQLHLPIQAGTIWIVVDRLPVVRFRWPSTCAGKWRKQHKEDCHLYF